MQAGTPINWGEIMAETYDSVAACLHTNYHGAKRTTEALLPLLQLSDSPRIVNVSSGMGRLKVLILSQAFTEAILLTFQEIGASECLQIDYKFSKAESLKIMFGKTDCNF